MAFYKATNPLRKLGYTDYDYRIFRKYLHMPNIYLRGIFRRYPKNLEDVPLHLSKLLQECDSYLWGRYKMALSKEEMVKSVRYRIARVPPMYMNRREYPATNGKNLAVYTQILENINGFAGLGRVLYLHSTFEEQALLAASNIIKAAIDNNLKACMLTFSSFMDEIKTFEESKVLKGMDEADIAALTMLGTVYKAQSGFTEATFCNFVDQRRMKGKSTLLSSHLTPAEFRERYGIDLARFGTITMAFEDNGVMATVAQLGKELAALKGGK